MRRLGMEILCHGRPNDATPETRNRGDLDGVPVGHGGGGVVASANGQRRNASHPPLAMAAQDLPNTMPVDLGSEPQLPVPEHLEATPPIPDRALPQLECRALPTLSVVRDVKPYRISFKFEGNRLWATFQGEIDGMQAECRIAADYHLTKDSMLYGIITSAEFVSTAESLEDQMEADKLVKQLFDQPFALRYRLDEDTLTVKDFKIGPITEPSDFVEVLMPFIVGCYRPSASPPASL